MKFLIYLFDLSDLVLTSLSGPSGLLIGCVSYGDVKLAIL
jgi:hypothetical protein